MFFWVCLSHHLVVTIFLFFLLRLLPAAARRKRQIVVLWPKAAIVDSYVSLDTFASYLAAQGGAFLAYRRRRKQKVSMGGQRQSGRYVR